MKVRVADATEKDFDLHVAVRWIASRNCCLGQRRCLTGSRISFRFVSAWMHTRTLCNNAPASSDAFGEEYLRKSETLRRKFDNKKRSVRRQPQIWATRIFKLGWFSCVPAFLRDLCYQIFRESYAQCSNAWRCRRRQLRSRGLQCFFNCATWRRTARHGQSAVSHLGCGARNNIGNTIGTSRADLRDESNLCAAIPLVVATRSRQNN